MGIEGKGFLINRTARETRNAEIGPTDLRQHPQGEDLLPLPRRWADVCGTRSSRAIPSARRGDLPRRNFLPQPIQGLDLMEVCALAKGRNALGNQLKDNGSEIAEAGKDLGGESHQIEVSLARVRVYPIAALDLHASQMHFPNALQRKAGHDIADPGTAVLLIDPKVGEIEQYSAIGLFGDGCEKFAIRQFVITKAKVVYSSRGGVNLIGCESLVLQLVNLEAALLHIQHEGAWIHGIHEADVEARVAGGVSNLAQH